MDKCIFCEIAAKRITAMIIYEDERFMAFLDINPLNPGHALIIPKKHVRWTFEVEDFGDYWEVAKSAALAAMDGLKAGTVNFITMGYSIEHAHIHVVPRFENDGHGEMPDRRTAKPVSKDQMQDIFGKMSSAIANHRPQSCSEKISAASAAQNKQADSKPEHHEHVMSEEDVAYIRGQQESG
jgi:histidine triad (HIT) family protein